MKQIIVMIATILLGLFIFGIIMDFKTPAENAANSAITTLEKELNTEQGS